MLKITNLMLILLFVISCSKTKEQKEISSGNRNKEPKFSLVKKMEIISDSLAENQKFFQPTDFTVDNRGNIYILDYNKYKIKKFDSQGKFQTEFSGKGQGPGETENPISVVAFKDSIFISDKLTNKILVFNTEGEFLHDIFLANNLPDVFSPAGDNFLGVALNYQEEKSGKLFFTIALNLYDSKLRKFREIFTQKTLFQMDKIENPFNSYPNFIGNGENIYLAPKSENKYEILSYSPETGKDLKKISRPWRKIAYSKEEIMAEEKHLKMMLGIEKEKIQLKHQYKYAIKALFIDKYQNIWAIPECEGKMKTFKADIFAQSGELKGKVTLELPLDYYSQLNSSVKFVNNKIYVLNKTESKVFVYEYSYK